MLMGLIEVDVVMTQLEGPLRSLELGQDQFSGAGCISWGPLRIPHCRGSFVEGAVVWKCRMPCAPPLTSGLGSHGQSVWPQQVTGLLWASTLPAESDMGDLVLEVPSRSLALNFLSLLVQDLWRLVRIYRLWLLSMKMAPDFQIALRLDIICVYWSEHWSLLSL